MDASLKTGLGSVRTGAQAPGGTPASGVTSFNGATGAVGYAPVILATTQSNLATFPTIGSLTTGGYQNGQRAFCATGVLGVRYFTLMNAVSVAPDNVYIVPTSDDVTRQWVCDGLCNGIVGSIFSPEIDFTAVGNTVIVPPMTGFKFSPLSIPQVTLTAKDGTVITAPTLNVGVTSPNFNDFVSGNVNAAFTTQAVNTRIFLSTVSVHPSNADFSANGIVIRVSSGAVLGTATQLRGRVYYGIQIAEY